MARKLLYVWAGLDALHILSGVVSIVVPIILMMMKNKNLLLSLIISNEDLNAAFIVAGFIFATVPIGLYGIIKAMKATKPGDIGGLKLFNWSLVLCAFATATVGTVIWFFTLRERVNFETVWVGLSSQDQQSLQDDFECCGYDNATTAGLFQVTTGFCADVAAGTNDTAIFGCANTILAEADFDLNNLFSTIFGFTCIQSALFLITCCVINWRHEELRFRKIDSKRYGTA